MTVIKKTNWVIYIMADIGGDNFHLNLNFYSLETREMCLQAAMQTCGVKISAHIHVGKSDKLCMHSHGEQGPQLV